MTKQNLAKVAKSVQMAMRKHSPEILTGIGIAGMITTVVFAVRATPKALSLIDEEVYGRYKKSGSEKTFAEWLGVDSNSYCWIDRTNTLTPMEIIRLTWKCYIPTAVMGSASILCVIGASSTNLRRNAALAAACTLSESTLKNYREKVVETIGEKKERTIRDAVAKDVIDRNPIANREVILIQKGDTLCYDVISGRYFKSDINTLKKAENELNRRMRNDMYISLNEFYYEIGLSGTTVGEGLGWHIDSGYIELYFSSQLADDGTPCLVMGYSIEPRYDYYKYS
jgi:hypothetical protein